ncbi:MAG: glycosyltransferase family 2 protein, partial [Anaerolineae bacterium]|nr:glycosyltransferase family 2 protein [Anaerolineae bacterium]
WWTTPPAHGSAEMVRNYFSSVHLIANTTNKGFTGGNNDGLRLADELMRGCVDAQSRFLFLLNPDTEVQPGALDLLSAYAQENASVGLIGPRLRYGDGSMQLSRRRFPTLLTAMFESTWLQRFAPRDVLHQFYMHDQANDAPGDVDWVVGAAMFVRYESYRQVGLLDNENFFMYSEETDWCIRMKDAGWRVVYLPQAEVVHYEGRSSGQVSALRMKLFNTSKVRYFAKHHGWLQAGVLRLWLLGQFAWQLGLEGTKWVLGNQREMRAVRIRAYLDVLRSGLR